MLWLVKWALLYYKRKTINGCSLHSTNWVFLRCRVQLRQGTGGIHGWNMVGLHPSSVCKKTLFCSLQGLPSAEKKTETKEGTRCLARWRLWLLKFGFGTIHWHGAHHQVLDAMSEILRRKNKKEPDAVDKNVWGLDAQKSDRRKEHKLYWRLCLYAYGGREDYISEQWSVLAGHWDNGARWFNTVVR